MEKSNNGSSRQDEIAKRAYLLWEKAGKPAGQDMAFWLEAEREVPGTNKPAAKPAVLAR
jgi:hypothetical protein